MDDVVATDVLLTMDDDTSTAHVATTSDHNNITGVELDEVGDFASFELELDSVVDLDQRVRITDGAAVVGNNVWDALSTNTSLLDLQKLVGSLLGGDAVNGKAALDVVEKTEVLARLLEGDNV